MEAEIIVIDKIEEAEDNKGKAYLKITDKAGVTRNFKEGRSKLLTNKGHLLKEGVAVKLHFEDYKAPSGQIFPFVKDFIVVEDVFVAQAAERVQGQVKTERNDSIEAQVAFKGMVELIATGMIKTGTEEYKATIRWAMARIDLPAVIVEKIGEAKGETSKDNKSSQETQTKPTDRQGSGETADVKTAGQLFSWIMSKDKNIKSPRVWVQAEFGLDDKEVLTAKKVQELYQEIKQKMGW